MVEKGADCGLDTPCCRRDCPVHVRLQFQIEHCHTAARRHYKTNRFDYRITRILHDINQKLYMPKELTIVSLIAKCTINAQFGYGQSIIF